MLNHDQRQQILFVLWDGGGNVAPQLAIARRLVDRGHAVRVLAPAVLESRIAAAGCQFVPYRKAPDHDSAVPDRDLLQDWRARTPPQAAAMVRKRVMMAPALAFAEDVVSILEEQPADVVLADYLLLGAYLGAEKCGVPTVSVIHHAYPLPAPGLPPFGLGFTPMDGPLGRLRDAFLRRIVMSLYLGSPNHLNATRATLGLAPITTVLDVFHGAARALVLTSPAFDFPATKLPANVRYTGFPLEAHSEDNAWPSPWQADDARPLVVASFSTTFQRQGDVVSRVVRALATMPVRALVTTGPALDATSLPEAENVVLRSYIPHRQIFSQANAVITHAGHGTVMTALALGVPVLGLPMGRDQNDVAARVAWRGAGLSISNSASPEKIRHSLQRILNEPHFRAGARRIATAMEHEDGISSAANEIEALGAASRSKQVATLPG